MNTIYEISKRTIASLMLAVVLFSVGVVGVRAQSCPGTTPDNSGISWTGGGCQQHVSLTYDGGAHFCDYTICWCYRYISSSNTYDYVVSSIKYEGSPCSGGAGNITNANFAYLVDGAISWLDAADPKRSDYLTHTPPCDGNPTPPVLVRRIRKGVCWSITTDGDGHGYANPCDGTGRCISIQNICKDSNGDKHVVNISSSEISGTCTCNVLNCN
ncbi:MAG: hypothetical protein WCH46_03810 [bacterium]